MYGAACNVGFCRGGHVQVESEQGALCPCPDCASRGLRPAVYMCMCRYTLRTTVCIRNMQYMCVV